MEGLIFGILQWLLKLTCPMARVQASHPLTKSLTKTSKKWFQASKMWELPTQRTSWNSSLFWALLKKQKSVENHDQTMGPLLGKPLERITEIEPTKWFDKTQNFFNTFTPKLITFCKHLVITQFSQRISHIFFLSFSCFKPNAFASLWRKQIIGL